MRTVGLRLEEGRGQPRAGIIDRKPAGKLHVSGTRDIESCNYVFMGRLLHDALNKKITGGKVAIVRC